MVGLVFVGSRHSTQPSSTTDVLGTESSIPSVVPPEVSVPIGVQTKTENCLAHDALPDAACTPGAIIPTATKDQICTPGYSSRMRSVPDSEKKKDYLEYGISTRRPGQYEVDHLISLELGGSNDIANLWPELAIPRPGFHEKDRVENYLHKLVCDGAVDLATAQQEIAQNWLGVYATMPK